jgi:hypothetical protein
MRRAHHLAYNLPYVGASLATKHRQVIIVVKVQDITDIECSFWTVLESITNTFMIEEANLNVFVVQRVRTSISVATKKDI